MAKETRSDELAAIISPYPTTAGLSNLVPRVFRLLGQRGNADLKADFCDKTTKTVTEQPIKNIEFFRCLQSLPGVAPLTKKAEDSGYEIAGLSR